VAYLKQSTDSYRTVLVMLAFVIPLSAGLAVIAG